MKVLALYIIKYRQDRKAARKRRIDAELYTMVTGRDDSSQIPGR